MTLVLSVVGRASIFLMADRRLSALGKTVADDAVKLMRLGTPDGGALLGYAGLGKTPGGTQPSEWMAQVLRSTKMPVEASLGEIAAAMQEQMPRFLRRARDLPHIVLAPAIVDGEARQYALLLMAPAGVPPRLEFHRLARPGTTRTPRIAFAGSGALVLQKKVGWVRPLLRLVSAYERGRVSPQAVAKELAALNLHVHQREKTVGPNCLVAWRGEDGGGSCEAFNGAERASAGAFLPAVDNGYHIKQIMDVTMQFFGPKLEAQMRGEQLPEEHDLADRINARLAELPWDPDRKLD